MNEKYFDALFREAWDNLAKGAKLANTNISELCRGAGVGRALASRWGDPDCVPETVRKMADLQRALAHRVELNKLTEASRQAAKAKKK